MPEQELKAKISADASAFLDSLKKSVDGLNKLTETARKSGSSSPVSPQTMLKLREYKEQVEKVRQEMEGLAGASGKVKPAPSSGGVSGGGGAASVVSQIKGMATSFMTFSAAVGLFKSGIEKWKQIQDKLFADRLQSYADTASGLQAGRSEYAKRYGAQTDALKGIISLTGKGNLSNTDNAELERLIEIANEGSSGSVIAKNSTNLQEEVMTAMEELRYKTISSINNQIKTNEKAINDLNSRIIKANPFERLAMKPQEWQDKIKQLMSDNDQLMKERGAIASSPAAIDFMRKNIAEQADRFAQEMKEGADAVQKLRESMWSAGEAAARAKEAYQATAEQQRKSEKDYEKTKKNVYAEEKEAVRVEKYRKRLADLNAELSALENKRTNTPRRFHRKDARRITQIQKEIADEEQKEQERQEKNAVKSRHDRLRKQLHDSRVRRRQSRRATRAADLEMENANHAYRHNYQLYEDADNAQNDLVADRTKRIDKLNIERGKLNQLYRPNSAGTNSVYSDLMKAAQSLEKLADKAIIVK